jgi:phospholipid-binding lipoprotein MlaA
MLFTERHAMFVRVLQLFAVLAALVAGVGLGGCATVPAGGVAAGGDDDPFESFNRGVFAVNQRVDRAVIKPVAQAYRATLPEVVRDRIRSFIDNLKEPLVFANDMLQGRGEAAGITGRRFLINSTWGIGGLFDKAGTLGMPRQSGDFGQTLYAWGIADGPYLMLPLFGPSNVRDAIGMGVDAYASPIGHVGSESTRRKVTATVGIVGGIDERARNIETLEGIEASSIDFYAYLRSLWRQNRQATLREAKDAAPADDDLSDPGATKPADTPKTPPP